MTFQIIVFKTKKTSYTFKNGIEYLFNALFEIMDLKTTEIFDSQLKTISRINSN